MRSWAAATGGFPIATTSAASRAERVMRISMGCAGRIYAYTKNAAAPKGTAASRRDERNYLLSLGLPLFRSLHVDLGKVDFLLVGLHVDIGDLDGVLDGARLDARRLDGIGLRSNDRLLHLVFAFASLLAGAGGHEGCDACGHDSVPHD